MERSLAVAGDVRVDAVLQQGRHAFEVAFGYRRDPPSRREWAE